MPPFVSEFLSGLTAIVLLDIVLAGDNAIVIALAARRLPEHLQRRAIIWGSAGAVLVRASLTAIVVWLLKLPGLMLIGGLMLLPIAWNLLKPEDPHVRQIKASSTFGAALRTIIVADALMGLDNVLAIAGASQGHLGMVVLGLAISVPLVVWGSTLILRLIERFPVIVYVGAGAIAFTSSRMIAHDHWLSTWFAPRPWAAYALAVLLVAGICAGGALAQRRHRQLQAAKSAGTTPALGPSETETDE